MKNLENARVNVIKKVLKVVGIVVVSGLVVVAGFEIFTSIYFNPHDVRLTNVTDTSFTVSWVTNYPKRGVVYYKEKDNILPGVLSWIGTGKAFDDRDVANAEKKCVDEFNKKAEVSEDFVVDTSNYNCESVKVSRLGSYYTHHVTVTNLEPGKEYYFRVGDGFVSWKRDMNQTYTFYSLEKEVKAPSPIFGKITNEEGQYVNDSIVYVKFINGYTKKESIYYSSVTADNGSWYLDGNNIRTIDGELMLVEGGQDTIQVHAQYKNFILTDAYEWVYGDSNIAYPDIVVSDTAEKDLSMNRGVVVDALAALDAGGGGGSTNTVDAGIDTPAKIPIRATPTAPAASATPTAATTRPATTPTAATTSTPAATTPTTTTPTATTPIEQKPQNPSPQAETSKTGFNVSSNITKEMQNTLIALVDSGKTSEARKYAEVIGLGNSARILANQEDVPAITVDILEKLGLAGDSSMSAGYRQSIIVGNMNAIAGYKDKESNLKTSDTCIESSCEGGYEQVYIVPGSPVKVGNPPVSSSVINGGGNAESGAFENGSLVGSVANGESEVLVVIPLVFGSNQKLLIPDYLEKYISSADAEAYAKGCIDKSEGSICKINIALSEIDPYLVLARTMDSKETSPIAENIVMMLNAQIKELFSKSPSISLNIKQGGAFTIKMGDLRPIPIGLEDFNGTDKVIITDSLRKIFPQLAEEDTILVKDLESLFRATNDLYTKYYDSIAKSSTDGGKTTQNECNPSCSDGTHCEGGSCVPDVCNPSCSDGTHCEGGSCVPDVCNPSCLDGTHCDRGNCVPNVISGRNGDCSKITCGEGAFCVNGVCASKEKVIKRAGTNNDAKYISSGGVNSERKDVYYNNILCLNPDGCDCVYTNFTKHVGELGICENEKVVNSTKDKDDDGIFSRGDANETITAKYSVLDKYLSQQLGTIESLREEAQKKMETAEANMNSNNAEPNLIEYIKAYDDAVANYNFYDAVYTDILNQAASVEDLQAKELEKVNVCLGTLQSEKDYLNCVFGDSVTEYRQPDVKGVSDSSADTSSNSLGTGYITYLPEYGFFDLEIEGLVEGQKVEGGEGNLRIFYVEMNGESGLQLPADPDNPQVGEDIVLRTNALNITYKKSAEVMTLNVKKGVNLISFSYLPQIKTDEYTKASDVILWLRSKGVKAENLSYFSAGRWRGIGYVDGEVTGEDFSITPGRGYLLYSLDDGQVSIPGYQLTSSVPISLSIGWNLVGIHGYSKVYTARSLLNSINKVEGLTANNISWWPTSKGKYEGLQLTDGKEYGFDFPISPNNGYFIRINKFEPKDTSCGSILWHEGGTHNGVCGDSKTL